MVVAQTVGVAVAARPSDLAVANILGRAGTMAVNTFVVTSSSDIKYVTYIQQMQKDELNLSK